MTEPTRRRGSEPLHPLYAYSIAPSNPEPGMAYFNLTDKIPYYWDGDEWIKVDFNALLARVEELETMATYSSAAFQNLFKRLYQLEKAMAAAGVAVPPPAIALVPGQARLREL